MVSGRSWKRGWRGTWLEGESFSGVRFTREIRNIRTYTGGVYTFCSSRLIRPSPRPFRPPISFLFLAGGGTKSGRGRRHKSLNPSPKGSGPLSLSLPPVFRRFFLSLRPWKERRGGGIEIALFFPSEFLDSRRRMSMFEKKFSRYGLWSGRNAAILVFYRPAGNFSRGLSVFLSKKGRFDSVPTTIPSRIFPTL